MTPQYAHLDGRHCVNDSFVKEVQDLYPATTFKMPLGYRTYVGWTGKDEVFFNEHDQIEGIDGTTYEVMFEPDNPDAFLVAILQQISHTNRQASVHDFISDERGRRQILDSYGETLDQAQRRQVIQKEAARSQGLYGYTKAIQNMCDRSASRLNKTATLIMRKSMRKDPRVGNFLAQHARRGSVSATVLVNAYNDSMPKLASDDKIARSKQWGMYGYPVKVANMGSRACGDIRQAAGVISSDLHRRRAAFYDKITGYFGEHSKVGKSGSSGLLLSVYPDRDWRYKLATPQSVEEWLDYDPKVG